MAEGGQVGWVWAVRDELRKGWVGGGIEYATASFCEVS